MLSRRKSQRPSCQASLIATTADRTAAIAQATPQRNRRTGAGNARVTRFDCTLPNAQRAAAARANLAPRCGSRAPMPAAGAAFALVWCLLLNDGMGRRLVASILGLALLRAPASTPRAGEAPKLPAAVAASTPAPSRDGDACRRMPAGKRLKLNLKPNTDLVDLVSWISAITCKQF